MLRRTIKQDKGSDRGEVAILDKMPMGGITVDGCRKSTRGGEESKCKDPEVGDDLVSLRNRKEIFEMGWAKSRDVTGNRSEG